METRRYYGTREAAAVLQVSIWTIYRMLNDGRLHGRTSGSRIRIPATQVQKLLEAERDYSRRVAARLLGEEEASRRAAEADFALMTAADYPEPPAGTRPTSQLQ